ncbi:MAG: hypothetical protein J5627_00305 [Bacilli bacterium]|nr:hypothetical protein [Bacilli bacterium]
MKKSYGILMLLPLLIGSCVKERAFEEKTIRARYVDSKYNTTCTLRYYSGSVIPYISLKEYHSLLYRGRTFKEGRDYLDIKTEKSSDGQIEYVVTVYGGHEARFIVENNTMVSDDLWSFKNTNLNNPDCPISYDGLPFAKVNGFTVDKKAKPTSINFTDYGLRFYGVKDDIYLPLGFCNDLFSNENILQGAYNTKDLYFFNYTENESLDYFGRDYYEGMYSGLRNEKERLQYADYYFKELCLDYDYFLGRPGRSTLEKYYDLSKSLDEALDGRPLGRKIKEYLYSDELPKILAGATLLGYLRNDGGHSVYSPVNTYYLDGVTYKSPSWLSNSVASKASELIWEEYYKGYPEFTQYTNTYNHHPEVYAARNSKLGKNSGPLKGTETYTKDGDTAYIHIDGFMGEIEQADEWKKYYEGKRSTIPFGDGLGGAVGAISYGVQEASKDDEIEHVVIDLAANTGGSTDEMLFMIGLLTGSKNFYTYNRMNDQYITATYDFDFNFDKVFDEKDDEMIHLLDDKDISVLTTKNGFSCGGISPIYLHDEGLFTIGEECGGGSCSIYLQYDAYGNENRASTPSQTVNKNGKSIDEERLNVCDHQITFPTDEGGSIDYTGLYDTSSLRNAIEEHYA